MSKFNKDYFPLLFAEVAKVLGEEEAERQLGIAWDTYQVGWVDCDDVDGAFAWICTPQGHIFWSMIDEGCNPNV